MYTHARCWTVSQKINLGGVMTDHTSLLLQLPGCLSSKLYEWIVAQLLHSSALLLLWADSENAHAISWLAAGWCAVVLLWDFLDLRWSEVACRTWRSMSQGRLWQLWWSSWLMLHPVNVRNCLPWSGSSTVGGVWLGTITWRVTFDRWKLL